MAIRRKLTAIVATMVGLVSACTSDPEPVAQPPLPYEQAFHAALDDGELILTFEPGSSLHESRGVAWHIEAWDGQAWVDQWVLAGGIYTAEEWRAGNYVVGDVGAFGTGPDVLPLPDLDADRAYQICEGSTGRNSAEDSCAELSS